MDPSSWETSDYDDDCSWYEDALEDNALEQSEGTEEQGDETVDNEDAPNMEGVAETESEQDIGHHDDGQQTSEDEEYDRQPQPDGAWQSIPLLEQEQFPADNQQPLNMPGNLPPPLLDEQIQADGDDPPAQQARILPQPVQLDQHRQPVRGDIIQFIEDEVWIIAKIIEKVQGYKYYFHIQLENGTRMGITCKPKTRREIFQWSLLPPEEWNPNVEQLLYDEPNIPSKQVTPASSPERVEHDEALVHQHRLPMVVVEEEPAEECNWNLNLSPMEPITAGRVYRLPPGRPQVNSEWHDRVRVQAAKLVLPPQQEHQRWDLAAFLVRSKDYEKENSAATKIKKALGLKK